MTPTTLHIVLHAPDADSLQRARMNAVNALRAEPLTQVRILANAAAVAEALDNPHEQADTLTYLCPNTLAHLGRECRAPLQALGEPAVLALARLQAHGWAYIRS